MADHTPGTPPVHMPSSTPWPMVMGLGITLMPAGLVLGPRLGAEGTPLYWLPLVTLGGLILFAVALYRMLRQDIDEAQQGGH